MTIEEDALDSWYEIVGTSRCMDSYKDAYILGWKNACKKYITEETSPDGLPVKYKETCVEKRVVAHVKVK